MKRVLSLLLFLGCGVLLVSVCQAAPLMVEKNLFSPDRKPPSPDSAESSQKASKPGLSLANIQLDGVIIQNHEKRAILRMKNRPAAPVGKKGQTSSPFVVVREGETVSDYHVSRIEAKSISLEKDGQTFAVSLFAENKVITPASPAAPVASPAPPPAQQPMAPGVQPGEQGAKPPPGAPQQQGQNLQNQQQADSGQVAPAPRVNPAAAGLMNKSFQQNVPEQVEPDQGSDNGDDEE